MKIEDDHLFDEDPNGSGTAILSYSEYGYSFNTVLESLLRSANNGQFVFLLYCIEPITVCAVARC